MKMNCEVEKAQCVAENRPHKEPGKGTFLVTIFIDILLLYFFNNLIYFNIPFLTKDIVSCLWAINLTLGFGILGNFIFLLYHPIWFIHLIQAAINCLAISAILIVYKIFPFVIDSEALQSGAKILLIVIAAGNVLGVIVELVRTFRAIPRSPKPPESPVPPKPPEPDSSWQI
jgi:hypothetical protein